MENILGFNWATIALIAGALLLIAAFFKVYSSAKMKKNASIVGAILVGVFLVAMFANISVLTKDIGSSDTVPTTTGAGDTLAVSTQTASGASSSGAICPEVSKTVTISGTDAYTSTAVGGTHRYRVNGNPAQTVSDGGTFTASPGDKIQILYMNGSLLTNYYSDVMNYEVPCYGSAIASKKLYKNGTITVDIFNTNGDKIDGSTNQTTGAGDTWTLTAKLTGQYQRGHPYGLVAVTEANVSQWDDVIVNLGGQKIGNPAFYTLTNSDGTVRSYSVPALLSNEVKTGTIYIDADDTNNPGNTQDVVVTIYPLNYFINEKKDGAYEGPAVADENDASTFGHVTAATLSVT